MMKTQLTAHRSPRGLTLIEVTLVIAVLLGLITVLFIGATGYKKASDRAKCLVNSSTVQKAVRSYANLYQLSIGDPLDHSAKLIGSGKMFEAEPVCPKYGVYLWYANVPASGSPYIDCHDPDNSADHHFPQNTGGW